MLPDALSLAFRWQTSLRISPMSENYCPICGAQLALESINITEGVALCESCGQLSRLSEVASRKRPIVEVLRNPPTGCSVTDWGQYVLVHATLRSVVGFFGTLVVALFWNGITLVFVLIALAGLYTNLVGPLPPWFPAPDFDDSLSLGMALFLCIFLFPFVAVGLAVIGAVLLNAAGKIEVVVGDKTGIVRTGIGFLAWRRRFDPTQVRRVTLGTTSWYTNGEPNEVIIIEADRTIKFGTLLRDERREWLQAILHELLTNARPALSSVWPRT